MRSRLAMMVLMLGLTGCGTATQPSLTGPNAMGVRAMGATVIDLPGVPVGQALKLAGKYKSFKLTGTGTVRKLDDSELSMAAKVTGKLGPISQTKDVTFSLTKSGDAQWPYVLQVVNVTDKETHKHKAALSKKDGGSNSFKLDDGSTALLAADGKGGARFVYGDFDLTLGQNVLKLIGPAIENAPSSETFFTP